ncbi:MAG TPA: cyclic nucleotide-binding domain-containing protein [Polyangiaceae bacterium]|nr:cyclic nucleotide-binding domain-containing protein [Polyangiaceae bacterium]
MSEAPPAPRPDDLRGIGLFGALPDDVLAYLCQTLEGLEVGPGQLVFREGDSGRELFVVLEGRLEVLKRSSAGVDTPVASLGPHDWFGEMSVIDVQPRSATVRALCPARLLRVRAADLDALYRRDLKAYALLVLNIARELSRRLRAADGLLVNFIADVMAFYVARGGGTEPPPPGDSAPPGGTRG